jgi:hypothetical protein
MSQADSHKNRIRFELDKLHMCVSERRHPKDPTLFIREGYAKSQCMKSSKKLIGGFKFEKNKNSSARFEKDVRESFHELVDNIVTLMFDEITAQPKGTQDILKSSPDWDSLLNGYMRRRNVDDELKCIETIANSCIGHALHKCNESE